MITLLASSTVLTYHTEGTNIQNFITIIKIKIM